MPVRVLRITRQRPVFPPPLPHASLEELHHGQLSWIDIRHPTEHQMEYVRTTFPVHPLDLEDCLSSVQRPKLDDYEDEEYFFMVLHFPRFNKQTQRTIMAEVDMFVGRNYVITVHDAQLKPLTQLFDQVTQDVARREHLMGRGSGFLCYGIADALVRYGFPIMHKIDEHTTAIEARIFDRKSRGLIEEMSLVRRDIITLRRIIRPNLPVLRQLASRERAFLNLDEDVYFGDLVDLLSKQWDMLEDNRELIEGLNATLDSLTSHRINDVIKTLTIISVVLLPMTLIASIYGMNVILPLQEDTRAFLAVFGAMLLCAAAMVAYFRWRDWV